MVERILNRRAFLRLAAGTAAGVVLGACQPQVIEKVIKETVEVKVEKVVKETVVVTEKQEVTKVVEKQVTAQPVTAPVTIEAWGWCCITALDNAAKAAGFYDKHSNVTFNLVEGGDYWSKITPAAAAGNLPDCVMSLNNGVANWYEKGIVSDITAVADLWEGFYENMEPTPVNELKTSAGRLLGFPLTKMIDGIGFIRAPFEDAGIPKPEEGLKTWDDYFVRWKAAGKNGEIRFEAQSNADPGFMGGALASWSLANVVRSTGLGLFDKGLKLRLNDPAWKTGFEIFKKQYDEKLDFAEGWLDYPTIYANVLAQKLAGFTGHCGYIMGVLGAAFQTEEKAWRTDHPWWGKVAWTLMPALMGGEVRAGPSVGEVICMTDMAVQRGTAITWMEWVRHAIGTDEGNLSRYSIGVAGAAGLTSPVLWKPSQQNVKLMDMTMQPLGDLKIIKLLTEQAKTWPEVNWSFTAADGDIYGILGEYNADMMTGKIPIEDGFEEAYKRAIDEVLPKYADKGLHA